jgi:ABC-type branched-subunit amino acid transport system substrate-binding protein
VKFINGLKRNTAILLGSLALLSGCAVIPDSGPAGPATQPVDTRPSPDAPDGEALPQDAQRHRVALLVPLSGRNAAVGQSIANATTMALLDTNADNLRITTYDTGSNPGTAAARAIADGNKLILGPLMGGNVTPIIGQARPADVPVITFSNDVTVASRDVFVMGHIPSQSIATTVRYARGQGMARFAALIPDGEYGRRSELALRDAIDRYDGQIVAVERYDRGNTSIRSAADRLRTRGGFDAVLIADGPELAAEAAARVKPTSSARVLGTELWSGESSVVSSAAMRGAWYSAVPDGLYKQFYDSYRSRFGEAPHRIATLGYDAVLLTLNIANDWQPGSDFPVRRLRDDGGFIGIDGTFRFGDNGIGQRLMEVYEVRDGSIAVVQAASKEFDD